MTAPLYLDASPPSTAPKAGNLGLWYTRFFDRYRDDWTLEETSKLGWIQTATHKPDPSLVELLKSYADRRFELVGKQGALRELKTSWHFVTGLGLEHPVENGFAWHPTLGTPYLPGSSVKGLLAAWLYSVEHDEDKQDAEREEAKWRREHWCGKAETPGDDDDPGHVGSLIFFDALPSAVPTLAADVMTPHMGKWYSDGDSIQSAEKEPEKVPADWHSPIPVPFLVVKDTCFHFAVLPRPGASWDGRDSQEEAALALDELGEALRVLGAGAKTAAGYGRFQMSLVGGFLYQELKEAEEERKRRQRERERLARVAPHFGDLAPSVLGYVGPNQLSGLTTFVLKAMDDGKKTRDECIRLAESLSRWMKSREEWIEGATTSTKVAKKKRSALEKTLKVMKWLEKET